MSLHDLPIREYSRGLSAIAIVLVLAVLPTGLAGLGSTATAASGATVGVGESDASLPQDDHAAKSGAEGEHSLVPTIAKIVNFAVLVAILVYFLRTPIATYLRTRSETIRKDLVEAAALRTQAERQLSDVRSQLAALPAELDALRRRGEEELASERTRMKAASAKVREQLLERTRRDIDLQFRQARRKLVEHTAELAITLARRRIERMITAEDQSRLVERYATEVQA